MLGGDDDFDGWAVKCSHPGATQFRWQPNKPEEKAVCNLVMGYDEQKCKCGKWVRVKFREINK